MYSNPFTYLLFVFILFFVLSIFSLSEKTQLFLKYLCVSVNGIGLLVVGLLCYELIRS